MSETAAMIERRFLSYSQAAGYCGISVSSLRRAVEEGRLRSHRPSPGRVVFDRHELDQWVHASGGPTE